MLYGNPPNILCGGHWYPYQMGMKYNWLIFFSKYQCLKSNESTKKIYLRSQFKANGDDSVPNSPPGNCGVLGVQNQHVGCV